MCRILSYHASLLYYYIVLNQRESSYNCFSNYENFLVVWSPNYAEKCYEIILSWTKHCIECNLMRYFSEIIVCSLWFGVKK